MKVKCNGSLSGSFPISNGVKQGCILAPTLFSIFFSIMLHEAKKRTCQTASTSASEQMAVSLIFGISLNHMKTIEELITELLFADDCVFLNHMEEALQHIVNCFSDAAKNFGLIISLKKTEVLYQPPPLWHTVLLTSASMAPT